MIVAAQMILPSGKKMIDTKDGRKPKMDFIIMKLNYSYMVLEIPNQ